MAGDIFPPMNPSLLSIELSTCLHNFNFCAIFLLMVYVESVGWLRKLIKAQNMVDGKVVMIMLLLA